MEIRVLSFVAKGKKEAQFDFDLQFKCGAQDITKKTSKKNFICLICQKHVTALPPGLFNLLGDVQREEGQYVMILPARKSLSIKTLWCK
mmetsp:Transcript_30669/g.47315  ORF Transcript_30669/g.47315 Transcript_30669/m.47315 type:complete len:89 (+) Transcript_30669:284-550(+)